MNKFIMVLAGLIAFTCLTPVPGVNAQTKTPRAKAAAAPKIPKATTIAGMVSDDGKTFVADKDKKSWTIENPDAVQADAGQHVRISAQADAATNEVTVKSVKVLTAKAKTPKAAKTPAKKS